MLTEEIIEHFVFDLTAFARRLPGKDTISHNGIEDVRPGHLEASGNGLLQAMVRAAQAAGSAAS